MRFSILLSLAAVVLAAYSLWSVRQLEKRIPSVPPAAFGVQGALDALLSEAKGHCERAGQLIRERRAKEAAGEIEKALKKLSEAERLGRAKEGVGDLIKKAVRALKALRERLERERAQ